MTSKLIRKPFLSALACCVGLALANAQDRPAAAPQTTITTEQMQLWMRMLAGSGNMEQLIKMMQSAKGQSTPAASPGVDALMRLYGPQPNAEQIRQFMLMMQTSGGGDIAPQGSQPALPQNSLPAPVVILRQDGRQAPLTPTRRETRFVVSQGESFGDVIKAELIAVAIRTSADVAQQQLLRALSGQADKIGGHLPYAGGRIFGKVGERVLSSRANKQRGFEFDYIRGIRSGIEVRPESPVEFQITPPNAFTSLDPVIVKSDVLQKEMIRVIASRRLELRDRKDHTSGQTPALERTLLKVETNAIPVHVEKKPDGTVLVKNASPLQPGEYTLAFRRPDDSQAFALLDDVVEFEVGK